MSKKVLIISSSPRKSGNSPSSATHSRRERGRWGAFAAYALGSFALGLAAVAMGYLIARQ